MTKVTGDLISIDDSAYDGFKGMTVYGKTVQNLWVNPSGTNGGITVTANANGSLTLSGTPNVVGSSPTISTGKIYTLKPNTTYIAFSDKAIADEYASNHGACLYVSQYKADGSYITDKIFAFTGNLSNIFVSDSELGYALCRLTVRPNTTVSGTYRVMLREATPEEIAKDASTPQTLPVYPDGSGPDASNDELGIMPLDGVSLLADSDFDDYWCPPGLSSIDEVGLYSIGRNFYRFEWATEYFSLDPSTGWIKFDVANGGGYVYCNFYNKPYFDFGIGSKMYLLIEIKNFTGVDYISLDDGRYNIAQFTSSTAIYDNAEGSTIIEITEHIPKNCATHMLRLFVSSSNNTSMSGEIRFSLFRTKEEAKRGYVLPDVKNVSVPLSTHSLRSLPDGTRDELHIDKEGNCTLVKRVGSYTPESGQGQENENDFVVYILQSSEKADKTYRVTPNEVLPTGPGMSFVADESFALIGNDGNIYANIANSADWTKTRDMCIGKEFIYKLATPQTISLGKISLPKLRKKPLVNNIWANGTASGTNFALAPEIDYEYNQWSTYCDGFKTHGKHSYFDMGCCIAARDTGTPEKKSVTATVPYMSGFYDLSKLYGAIAFEARQLMYRFEFVTDTREELQQKKSQFLEWLSQVHDEEIADDDIPGRHFIGSLSEWEFEEGEEGQSGSLEVTFNCQPFLEADEDTTKTCNAGSNTVTVEGQAVNAYAKTNSGTATIQIGGVTQSVGTTEIRLSVQLQPGDNAVTVTGSPVVLRWKELTV